MIEQECDGHLFYCTMNWISSFFIVQYFRVGISSKISIQYHQKNKKQWNKQKNNCKEVKLIYPEESTKHPLVWLSKYQDLYLVIVGLLVLISNSTQTFKAWSFWRVSSAANKYSSKPVSTRFDYWNSSFHIKA